MMALPAKGHYAFNSNCLNAYRFIFDFKFEQAQQLINAEKKTNPDNGIAWYLEHYLLFLKSFISEEANDFIALKNHRDAAFDFLDKAAKNSPYHLYCKAEINLQTAFVKIKFKEYITGALEIRRAFKDLEENQRQYPDFAPNHKGLGIMHAFIGAVPTNYNWLLKLAGMHGTIQQGLFELEQLYKATSPPLSPYYFLNKEAQLVWLFSKQHLEKNNKEVLRILEAMPAPANAVEVFFAANIYYNSARNDDVINVIGNLAHDNNGYKMYYLNFLKGLALLNKLDASARDEFTAYLKNFKGTSFVKASHQRLAWLCIINADTAGYKHHMLLCKTSGSDFNDEDKQALKEAADGIIPNTLLLKARLLFDGGYYPQALAMLAGKPIENFPTLRDQVEVTYRLARIYDKTQRTAKAKELYTQTIDNGKNLTYYFAANSCLQLGLMYENENDKSNAEKYYRLCLSLRNHEYQNSIDQKAKAGLNRLGKNTSGG